MWEEVDHRGARGNFGGVTELFYISVVVLSIQLHIFVKTHRTAHLRGVNFSFTVCKLHVSKLDC